MLSIEIPMGEEAYNEQTREFFYPETFKLDLEHSLASLSKWESQHEKSFLNTESKTQDEALHYVECMVLTPDIPDGILNRLNERNVTEINEYIDAKMTATVFYDQKPQSPRPQTITAEILYHWMIQYNIPFECQHWHLNRLITLIQVCVRKNAPDKKMSQTEIAQHNRELNRKRKEEWGISG